MNELESKSIILSSPPRHREYILLLSEHLQNPMIVLLCLSPAGCTAFWLSQITFFIYNKKIYKFSPYCPHSQVDHVQALRI